MSVYIEIAFLENFGIDAALLWSAFLVTKRKISVWRMVIASVFGALFAVLFPLFSLPWAVSYFLKFSVGALIVYIAFCEKGWGRYAITLWAFYGISFCFAGAVFALSDFFVLKKTSVGVGGLTAFLILFLLGVVFFAKRLYKRSRLLRFVYPCVVYCGEKRIKADGFLDSGNRASAKGRPVCFLTPDLAYELLGAVILTEETTVLTVAGEKKIKLFKVDKLEIYCKKEPHIIENIYFSPSAQILRRDYKIVLGGSVLEK